MSQQEFNSGNAGELLDWGERTGVASGGEAEVSLCSMNVDGELFGIETAQVREVLGRMQAGPMDGGLLAARQDGRARQDLRRVPLAPRYVAGVMPYRGEVLTTLSFRALLGQGTEQADGCVLVLDDEETGERLGLLVDEVGAVVTVRKSMHDPNPCTLDARRKALFDGVYKMSAGLLVRIDPQRLHPRRLAATRLFTEEAGW